MPASDRGHQTADDDPAWCVVYKTYIACIAFVRCTRLDVNSVYVIDWLVFLLYASGGARGGSSRFFSTLSRGKERGASGCGPEWGTVREPVHGRTRMLTHVQVNGRAASFSKSRFILGRYTPRSSLSLAMFFELQECLVRNLWEIAAYLCA